jgi:ATP phosphoribosyltransferase
MDTDSKLKLAIQKSGRLHDASKELLRECGINVQNGGGGLKAEAYNFPLEVFYLRDDDIPQYVQDGVADCGIAGQNVVLEKKKIVRLEEKLGFGKCRLSIAVPKLKNHSGLADIEGLKIATSYPNLLTDYLNQNGLNAEIHEISGSVEIAPGIGLADSICDIVSSGSTLLANGLKEVEVVLNSEAVLFATDNLPAPKRLLLEKFLFRIRAVKKSRSYKYILLNAPNEKLAEIVAVLPGMKSPTVLPLAESGWSSLHSVVHEDHFWEIIEELKAKGAQGILVLPIEKMIL